MQNLFNQEDQRLLERLNKYILSGPNLSRLDPYRRFYIKTDLPKDGMREVLLKEDDSAVSRNPEAKEKEGGKYEFYKSLEGMFLRPIYFILISTVTPLENSRHTFVGEEATLRRAIGKFRKYLWGAEFMVMSDFNRLKKSLNHRPTYLTWYTGGETNFSSTNL